MNRNDGIEDANCLLHISNYKQNRDFEKFVQIKTHNNKNILKINTPDSLTYFRLQHELSEAKRKQEQFNILRNDRIKGLMTQNLIDYDKKIMNEDDMNHNEIEEKIKQTKFYKKGLELGKLLKPDIKIEKELENKMGQLFKNIFTLRTHNNQKEKSKSFMKSKTIKHQ